MWIYLFIILIVLILCMGFLSNRKIDKACAFVSLGAPILDTRTAEEYSEGHIKGSILIETPLPPLDTVAMTNLKEKLMAQDLSSRKAVVYCKKGIRSSIAQKILEDNGVEVVNLCGVLGKPLSSIVAGNGEKCLHWAK